MKVKLNEVTIEVITWDMNYRESLHSIYSLQNELRNFKNTKISLVGKTKINREKIAANLKLKLNYIEFGQNIYHPGILLNYAANKSEADYLLFCDGDLVFPENLENFLYHCILNNKIGLISRIDCDEIPGDDYTVSKTYKELQSREINKFFLNTSINNFIPMIFLSNKQFQFVGAFTELNCFSTMYSKFGENIFYKLKKYFKISVCPFPAFHQWHPTPKVQRKRFELFFIKFYLCNQKLINLINLRNKFVLMILDYFYTILFYKLVNKYKKA